MTCALKCTITPKCLSYNFCFDRICQLNNLNADSSLSDLKTNPNCIYAGMSPNDEASCFDSSNKNGFLGSNCGLDFKVGDLHATNCVNRTSTLVNITEYEVTLTRNCSSEIYCYRGQRLVDPSLCEIDYSIPFEFIRANYAGNLTWYEALDYCKKYDMMMRSILGSIYGDVNVDYNRLRRIDHPAYVYIKDDITEGSWLNHRKEQVNSELIWDPNPFFSDSDAADFGALNGTLFQAYGLNDTGPDVICARFHKPWTLYP